MYKFRNYFSETSDSYVVLNNFENANEKQCIKMDKKNEKIYSSLLSRAERASKAIGDTILSVNIEVPCPPRPSNRDRLIIWKKRNVSKKVICQSESVLFLNERGYKLNEDYEAYQAIDLANELKKHEGIKESSDDKSKQFDNIFNKQDKNILRRRSYVKIMPASPNRSLKSTPSSPNFTNHTHAKISFKFPEVGQDDRDGRDGRNDRNDRDDRNDRNDRDEMIVKPSAPPFSHNIIYPSKTCEL